MNKIAPIAIPSGDEAEKTKTMSDALKMPSSDRNAAKPIIIEKRLLWARTTSARTHKLAGFDWKPIVRPSKKECAFEYLISVNYARADST